MEINVKGVIVNNDDKWIYDWFGIDAVCPKDITEALKELKDDEKVIVQINLAEEMYLLHPKFCRLESRASDGLHCWRSSVGGIHRGNGVQEIYMVETA